MTHFDAAQLLQRLFADAPAEPEIGDRTSPADSAEQPEPRREAASVIRCRRDGYRDQIAIHLRNAWRERLAICMVDGGLGPREAEAIALEEVRSLARNLEDEGVAGQSAQVLT